MRGYRAASMEEIAKCSGVSVPVVYDHFASKQDLHLHLLERHFSELRSVWREHLGGGHPEERMPRALDAWFAYVQEHPYAWRMLFSETTGDADVARLHDAVAAQSRATMLPLLAHELGVESGPAGQEALEMVWEVVRGVLQGLAVWWYEHQHIPREQIVRVVMNTLWIGFDRARQGETWQP